MTGIRTRRMVRVLAVCLILAGMGTGVYAALQSNLTLTGTLQTGKVEIELNQPDVEMDDVTPGQQILYQPTVTAKGADCYVRLNVEIENQSNTTEPLTVADIQPADGWVWKENVLYSTKPLATGETATAIEEIQIPADWTEETASDFQIHLTADAIQKAHFTPNFQNASPWGTVEIEEHKEDAHPEYRTARAAKPEGITYVGDGLFEVPSGDLFANFPELLPGDEASDSITIHNGTSQPITLSFSSIPQKKELLDQIGMKLSIGGKPFYDGTLDGKGLESEQVLTTLEARESTELEYSISLPTNFENEFSLEADLLTWKLKAEEPDRAVQTQDDFPLYVLSALLIASGAFLFVMNRKGKEEPEP